jgi:hypothetical protein
VRAVQVREVALKAMATGPIGPHLRAAVVVNARLWCVQVLEEVEVAAILDQVSLGRGRGKRRARPYPAACCGAAEACGAQSHRGEHTEGWDGVRMTGALTWQLVSRAKILAQMNTSVVRRSDDVVWVGFGGNVWRARGSRQAGAAASAG